jgi:hypothetical protein
LGAGRGCRVVRDRPRSVVGADRDDISGDAHDHVIVSYNGGINFWIGNNPDSERTVAIRPGRSWDALDKELRLAGADDSEGEVQFAEVPAAVAVAGAARTCPPLPPGIPASNTPSGGRGAAG